MIKQQQQRRLMAFRSQFQAVRQLGVGVIAALQHHALMISIAQLAIELMAIDPRDRHFGLVGQFNYFAKCAGFLRARRYGQPLKCAAARTQRLANGIAAI